MTLQEKIQSIDPDKTKSPVQVREFINNVEKTAQTSETKAMALIDGLIAQLTLKNPDAIKSVTLTTEQAKRKLTKLKTLKAIVPKKADAQQIENQIRKQYPTWDDSKVKALAQLRIDAQISRADSFNKMIDTLGASQFYGSKELSSAPIDKNRSRSLEKDSKQGSITEAEERRMTGKKFKRISKAGRKNQFGTTQGGKVYYEYRMNRRDVDNKIRLKTGGDIPKGDKMFHLPIEIAVYVPSTMNVSKTITASELRSRVKEVEKYLAETFGGFTSAEKVGGYLSSKSSVITEKVVPVTAFATKEDFAKNKSKLVNKLSVWAKKWGQEAMGLEFEGDLYYVPQKFRTGGTLRATYIPNSDIKSLQTIWGNNIRGKDLLDGAYTTRKDIKKAPKVTRYFADDEAYEYGLGGLVDVDMFEALKKGDKITISYDSSISANNKATLEVKSKSVVGKGKVYEAEKITFTNTANPSGVKFYAYNRVKQIHNKIGFAIGDLAISNVKVIDQFRKGGNLYDTPINFGYDKRVKGKRIASSGSQIELRQNTETGEYCVFKNMYPITDSETEYKTQADQNYLFAVRMAEFKSGARKTMPQKPKMVRSIIEEEEYEHYAKGGLLEHGLLIGDKIIASGYKDNTIVVENHGVQYKVDLNTGKRSISVSMQ